ncbi:MAG: permease [Campylobacterota bacterium]|nr:permease [Campylobacterota bacterium]
MKNNKREENITPNKAILKAIINFASMMPMIIAVIGLIGILQIYITPDMLAALFGYSIFTDISIGTSIGAISSGNPAMSYIISESLLKEGVSLYAITAFILAWVTLGIVQLPAEASVFGIKFTIYKNILTLLSTMSIAYLTIITIKVIN